jgi:hypothetical protein
VRERERERERESESESESERSNVAAYKCTGGTRRLGTVAV